MPGYVGTWIEKPESRAGSVTATSTDLTRNWVVLNGGEDESDIFQAACFYNPPIFDRLIRTKIHQKPAGGGVWFVDVDYAPLNAANGAGAATGASDVTPPPEQDENAPLGPGYSFDTTGQTVHITQSIKTRSRTKRGGGVARDFKGAIGVTRDRVEGCDVFAPKLEFSVTVQRREVTLAYVKSVYRATGKTNASPVFGLGTEEVLYLGGSGQFSGGQSDRWSLTHKFAFAETQLNKPICYDDEGNVTLAIPEKRGWDYIWFTYDEAADPVNGRIVSLPEEAYVEQVYSTADLGTLLGA